jgi:general secretion pathway protein B
VSFILDALRKSDARRRMGQGPDIDGGLGGASPSPQQPGRGKSIVLLVAVLVVTLTAGLVYMGRDVIGEQVAQWRERSDPVPDRELTDLDPVEAVDTIEEPVPPHARGRQAELPPIEARRRAAAELRESDALPRERIVSDADQIEAELARRVAEDDDAESAESAADRRARRMLQQRSQVVVEAPQRDIRSEQEAEMARMERAMQEAEQQRELEARRQAEGERMAEARRRAAEERQREAEAEAERRAQLASSQSRTGSERPEAVEPVPEATEGLDMAAVTPPEEGGRWSPEAAEYIRAWELPLSIRRNLPELNLTIHVYSVESHRRFVLVNGQRFVIGDTIADGARLVDIQREGAIVDFREYRFLLEP